MRLFRASSRFGGWLAALAVGVFASGSALAGGHGQKIEFSDPGTPLVASNLTSDVKPTPSRLNPEPNRFKQAQEELFRPLTDAIAAENPLDFGTLPTPQQYQQSRQTMSRRARNQLEQRKNWAFTDFNDLYPEQSVEQALGIKDDSLDANDKTTSLIQRYYERGSDKTGINGNVFSQSYDPKKQDFTGAADLKSYSQQNLESDSLFSKNVLGALGGDNSDSSGQFNDGSRGQQQLVDQEAAAEKLHRQEFNHLLNPSLPAEKLSDADKLFADPAQAKLFGTAPSASTVLTQTPAEPYHSVLYPVGIKDPAADALHSAIYDDPTARALGLPNPAPVKPQAPSVTVDSIQRELDPYSAGFAKRKF